MQRIEWYWYLYREKVIRWKLHCWKHIIKYINFAIDNFIVLISEYKEFNYWHTSCKYSSVLNNTWILNLNIYKYIIPGLYSIRQVRRSNTLMTIKLTHTRTWIFHLETVKLANNVRTGGDTLSLIRPWFNYKGCHFLD